MIGTILRFLGKNPYARGAYDFRRPPDVAPFPPNPPRTMQLVRRGIRTVPPIMDQRPIDVFYLNRVNGVIQTPRRFPKAWVATSPLVEVR